MAPKFESRERKKVDGYVRAVEDKYIVKKMTTLNEKALKALLQKENDCVKNQEKSEFSFYLQKW